MIGYQRKKKAMIAAVLLAIIGTGFALALFLPRLTPQSSPRECSLRLHILDSEGEPIPRAWVILLDPSRVAQTPLEEGYNGEDGFYVTKHKYRPGRDLTVVVQAMERLSSYMVTIAIPMPANGCASPVEVVVRPQG